MNTLKAWGGAIAAVGMMVVLGGCAATPSTETKAANQATLDNRAPFLPRRFFPALPSVLMRGTANPLSST